MNQDDFRKILATPLTAPGTKAPSLLRRPRGGSKPQTLRREGRSDALEQSHVDLGAGFVDRAKERRLAELRGEGGETGEIRGLDYELLKKVRSGEFKLPEAPVEEEDEEAILDELLQMEREMVSEQQPERDSDEEEKGVEKEVVEKEVVEEKVTGGRFKPIVDAKVLKQMRREHKRRKMAMEGMDRLTKPMAPPPPPPAPKRSRAELLAELRRIQAAKRAPEQLTAPSKSHDTETEARVPVTIPDQDPSDPMPAPVVHKGASPSPPRASPPPPVKVGDNMFSDDSELSDYNPHPDSSDEDKPTSPQPTAETPVKRNYFGDSKSEEQEPEKKPLTMDPAMAAILRKAAALADKRSIPEEGKAGGAKRMGLGGSGGVYEFDEVDEWDGDLEEEAVQSRKKRRKEKK